ncbi:MAG: proline--tRNA ligase [Oscillospiraceae bacterium]|nr:proline--tRNA ligase [Oscillospiraceae bacterium]
MAGDKKQVESITSMKEDFAQWYTDVVTKAELIDYSSVKGLMVMRPYGFAIWENIQKELDSRFKATGHENVQMPMLIPESLLQKEKDHVEGFAPEVAWVTMGGSEELAERLCVRPTSETLFCEHWQHVVHSWRDLPKLYNQWCSVLRWEKTTRPFLRGREFLWQEGHTLHATAEEAMEETLRMLEIYADVAENCLAMPVIRGRKTDKEKFAGAEATYTIECMMHDHKALQGGTSHYFGDGFAKAFDICFADKQNKLTAPHQTSWGMSTRIIGGLIMTHGDDNGLVLPPKIAPVQIVIVPVASHKQGVTEAAQELCGKLKEAGLRVKLDDSDQSPGWKYAEHEMKGVPLRLELGPRDIAQGVCVMARRDNSDKVTASLEGIEKSCADMLDAIQADMYSRALENLKGNIRPAYSLEEAAEIISTKGGFIKSMWCGGLECELKMKDVAGVSSRCMPFEQEHLGDVCPICGKPAVTSIIWGVAY